MKPKKWPLAYVLVFRKCLRRRTIILLLVRLTTVLGNISKSLVGVCKVTENFFRALEVIPLTWKTLLFTMKLIHFALIYFKSWYETKKLAISLRFGL